MKTIPLHIKYGFMYGEPMEFDKNQEISDNLYKKLLILFPEGYQENLESIDIRSGMPKYLLAEIKRICKSIRKECIGRDSGMNYQSGRDYYDSLMVNIYFMTSEFEEKQAVASGEQV